MSVRSIPGPIRGVLLAGGLGILVGTLGIRLADDVAWVRFFDNVHWTSGTAAAAIAAWLSYRRAPAGERQGLFWIALGLIGYAVGQLFWDIQAAIGYAGFPAPSDLFYLWLGPFISVGLLKEINAYGSKVDRRSLRLDAAMLSIAVLALVLVLYLPKRGETDWLSLMVLVAYPVTLFGAAILSLLMIPALRLRLNANLWMFVLPLMATGLSWMNWNFMALDGTAIDGAWFNISFSVAVLLLGLSLVNRKLERNDASSYDRLCEGLLRLLPLVTVVIASLAVVFSHALDQLPYLVQVIADVGALAVVTLALLRQGALLKERDELLATQVALLESRHDLEWERVKLKRLIGAIPDLVWLKDFDGVYLSCNPRFEQLYGASEGDIIGKTDYDFVSRDLADFFRSKDRAAMEAGVPCMNEEWLTFASDGYRGLFETIKTPLFDGEGRLIGVLGIARDITERYHQQEALQLAGQVFQNSSEAILVTDVEGRIVSINPAFSAITGYSAEEAVGQRPNILRSGRQDEAFYRTMWRSLTEAGRWQGEIWNRRKNGEIFPEWLSISAIRDVAGNPHHFLGLFTDISERKKSEEIIWRQANYDLLTCLPNRRLLGDRMEQAIASCKRNGHYAALMFLDLDNFKPLNDTYGHKVGDLLLVEVAHRLGDCVRETDTVARFGGDEFVVLLGELDGEASEAVDKAGVIAEKIRLALAEPYRLKTAGEGGGQSIVEHRCAASIGVVVFGSPVDVDTLLKHGDLAMYDAKSAGRNRVVVDLLNGCGRVTAIKDPAHFT